MSVGPEVGSSASKIHRFSDRIRVRTKALLIRIWADPWDPDPQSIIYILIRICTRNIFSKKKKYVDDFFEFGNFVKKIYLDLKWRSEAQTCFEMLRIRNIGVNMTNSPKLHVNLVKIEF